MGRHSTVADVLTSDVVAVGPQATFQEIAHLLASRRISAVPVVDDSGYVLGVVSETDLLHKEEFLAPWHSRRLGRRGSRETRAKAAGRIAAELMTAPAIGVGLGVSLPMAARQMFDHDITRLVVMNADGTLAGIVTRSDLLRVFLDPDEQLRDRVTRRLIREALWEDPFAVSAEVRHGIVTLTGELERRSLAVIAIEYARTTDGVVDVDDRLTYLIDDTDLPVVPS